MQEEGRNCADATDGKLTTDNHHSREYKTMAATPATEGGGIVYSPDEDGNIPDFSLLDSYRENSFSRSREIFEPEGTTCLEFRLEVESRRKKNTAPSPSPFLWHSRIIIAKVSRPLSLSHSSVGGGSSPLREKRRKPQLSQRCNPPSLLSSSSSPPRPPPPPPPSWRQNKTIKRSNHTQ